MDAIDDAPAIPVSSPGFSEPSPRYLAVSDGPSTQEQTSILITHGTGQGRTKTVAAYIAAVLDDRDAGVTTRHVSTTDDVDVEPVDGALAGLADIGALAGLADIGPLAARSSALRTVVSLAAFPRVARW